MFDTCFHNVHGLCLATQAIDLRPSRDSRLHAMPGEIAANHSCIFFVMVDRMRTWAHDRHRTVQYIEQLREFVETRPAQYAADACHPWIIGRCLNGLPLIVTVDMHCPKLVDLEHLVHEAISLLPINNGSFAVEPNGQRDQGHER